MHTLYWNIIFLKKKERKKEKTILWNCGTLKLEECRIPFELCTVVIFLILSLLRIAKMYNSFILREILLFRFYDSTAALPQIIFLRYQNASHQRRRIKTENVETNISAIRTNNIVFCIRITCQQFFWTITISNDYIKALYEPSIYLSLHGRITILLHRSVYLLHSSGCMTLRH